MERIGAFLEACVKEEKKGFRFLMLTGSPGAGKSLCTNTLLSKMGIKVIKINANLVRSLKEVQEIIGGELLGEIGKTSQTAPQIIRHLEDANYK